MEDLQTKEVKKHQTYTAIPDDNGSDCLNISFKEQTKNPSPEDLPSVNRTPKLATFWECGFRENKPFVLPVQVAGGLPPKVGERKSSSLIVPASSISMVLDQHLNSQLPPSFCSYQFANIQKSALFQNLLPSQSETLPYNTDVPVFQSPGTATCLPDLISSLSNYASSEYQMTGPDKTIPSDIMPNETVYPISAPMTSLIPPATLLVPYPFVVPLPVPFPIPIPILTQIPQRLNSYIKTSRTASTNEKSTLTSPTNCTNSLFLQTPSDFQDEVLDLSFKATQTKHKLALSASPDSALDLSVANSNTRRRNHWAKDMNGQNTQCNWTVHEVNGNNIRRSKFEDYNGGIVCSTVIVSPTENAHAPFSDKKQGFSQDCLINSPMKPHRSQNTVPQDCSRKAFRMHPVCSEPHRQILNNGSVHFKRGESQNIYGNTPPNKKPHMTSFLSMM